MNVDAIVISDSSDDEENPKKVGYVTVKLKVLY